MEILLLLVCGYLVLQGNGPQSGNSREELKWITRDLQRPKKGCTSVPHLGGLTGLWRMWTIIGVLNGWSRMATSNSSFLTSIIGLLPQLSGLLRLLFFQPNIDINWEEKLKIRLPGQCDFLLCKAYIQIDIWKWSCSFSLVCLVKKGKTAVSFSHCFEGMKMSL